MPTSHTPVPGVAPITVADNSKPVYDEALVGPARRANIRENAGGIAVTLKHLDEGVEFNWPVLARHLCWDLAFYYLEHWRLERENRQLREASASLLQREVVAAELRDLRTLFLVGRLTDTDFEYAAHLLGIDPAAI